MILIVLFGIAFIMGASGVALVITRPRREAAPTIEWPPTWGEMLEQGYEAPCYSKTRVAIVSEWRAAGARPHRHNVHCPRCGRFSKAIPFEPLASVCLHHGYQSRIKFLE
jgi:hypothetical protein